MKIFTLFFVSVFTTAFAVVIAVPEPSEMITKSGIVASGFFTEKDGKALFTPTTNFKGALVVGQSYEVRHPRIGEALPDTVLAKTAGTSAVLFVGNLSQPNLLDATFGLCSVWPNGTTPELLPTRTLAECLEFTKAAIATNELSAKAVMSLEVARKSIKDRKALREVLDAVDILGRARMVKAIPFLEEHFLFEVPSQHGKPPLPPEERFPCAAALGKIGQRGLDGALRAFENGDSDNRTLAMVAAIRGSSDQKAAEKRVHEWESASRQKEPFIKLGKLLGTLNK